MKTFPEWKSILDTVVTDSGMLRGLTVIDKRLQPDENNSIQWDFSECLDKGKHQIKSEKWLISRQDKSFPVVIKYSPEPDHSFEKSADLLYAFASKPVDPVYISSFSAETPIRAILTPFIEGKTLAEELNSLLKNKISDEKRIKSLVETSLRAVKTIHDTACDTDILQDKPETIASLPFYKQDLQAPIIERILFKKHITKNQEKLYPKALKELSHVSPCSYIHRDCFAHNILIDADSHAHMLDWESLDTGFFMRDLSQLMASVILACVTSGASNRLVKNSELAIDKIYGQPLAHSILYQLHFIRALMRFSPLGRRYFTVVPAGISRDMTSRYGRILQPAYPLLVRYYYRYLIKQLKKIEEMI